MNLTRWFAVAVTSGALFAIPICAQQAPTAPPVPTPPTVPTPAPEPTATSEPFPTKSLRIQITFTDFDGDKKIDSLPYILHVDSVNGSRASIRMGLRLPIAASGGDAGKNPQITYVNEGTDIDCVVVGVSAGTYAIYIVTTRSAPSGSLADALRHKGLEFESSGTPLGAEPEPVIQQFDSETTLALRDGQSVESVAGTDPIGGYVERMDVTLNEEK